MSSAGLGGEKLKKREKKLQLIEAQNNAIINNYVKARIYKIKKNKKDRQYWKIYETVNAAYGHKKKFKNRHDYVKNGIK